MEAFDWSESIVENAASSRTQSKIRETFRQLRRSKPLREEAKESSTSLNTGPQTKLFSNHAVLIEQQIDRSGTSQAMCSVLGVRGRRSLNVIILTAPWDLRRGRTDLNVRVTGASETNSTP